MKIVIGSDHIGFPLKEDIKLYLQEERYEVDDIGCYSASTSIDYPDIALELATKISLGEYERGLLVCGTGIGMAITANKVPGIRAAVCHDPYSAERARKSNNAQIICFGSQIIAPTLARTLLNSWLASEFSGGRSLPKVNKIIAIDENYHRKISPD